jgi:hypothetical protein
MAARRGLKGLCATEKKGPSLLIPGADGIGHLYADLADISRLILSSTA